MFCHSLCCFGFVTITSDDLHGDAIALKLGADGQAELLAWQQRHHGGRGEAGMTGCRTRYALTDDSGQPLAGGPRQLHSSFGEWQKEWDKPPAARVRVQ